MAVKVPIVSSFDDKGIRDASSSLSKFDRAARDGLSRVASAAKIATAAVAGIGAGVAAAATKAISSAANIAESTSKINVIFGQASAEVIKFSKTAATQFGLSQQAVLDAAGTFGTFGKAAGLQGRDLSAFSNQFTALAADLASFNNTTPEEAIEALGAGLRGESEPLRRYGILLDDARLKARALELGIYEGSGALTAQQKILAAQAEILAQSTDAQGDFARTSDGLANQQRILKANLANVVAEIGTQLLPVALKIANFLNAKVIPAVQRLADTFRNSGIAGVVRSIVDWVGNRGLPLLRQKLGEWGKALIGWIGPRIGPLLARLLELVKRIGNWVLDTGLPWLVDKLIAWGNAFVDWIKPLIGPALKQLGQLLIALGGWIVDTALPKLIEQAKKLAPPLWEWIKAVTPELLKGLGGLLLDVGKWVITDGIPKLIKLGLDLGGAILSGLFKVLKDIGSGALGVAAQIVNAIIRFVNDKIIAKVNSALEFEIFGVKVNPPDIPPIPLIGGASSTGGSGGTAIPKLAKGGIVNSPTLAMIGEAGPEAVVPLDRGPMGTSIIVNVSGALDPVSVARQIRQLLNDDARRTGRPLLV